MRPYGVPLKKFVTFTILSFLSALAGAQTVHQIYKPLGDLDELISAEFNKLVDEYEERIRLSVDDKSNTRSSQNE